LFLAYVECTKYICWSECRPENRALCILRGLPEWAVLLRVLEVEKGGGVWNGGLLKPELNCKGLS
jgi:hypothetical protein